MSHHKKALWGCGSSPSPFNLDTGLSALSWFSLTQENIMHVALHFTPTSVKNHSQKQCCLCDIEKLLSQWHHVAGLPVLLITLWCIHEAKIFDKQQHRDGEVTQSIRFVWQCQTFYHILAKEKCRQLHKSAEKQTGLLDLIYKWPRQHCVKGGNLRSLFAHKMLKRKKKTQFLPVRQYKQM